MMMAAHIQGHVIHVVTGLQYLPTFDRVLLDYLELLIREASRFIEYILGYANLANIV